MQQNTPKTAKKTTLAPKAPDNAPSWLAKLWGLILRALLLPLNIFGGGPKGARPLTSLGQPDGTVFYVMTGDKPLERWLVPHAAGPIARSQCIAALAAKYHKQWHELTLLAQNERGFVRLNRHDRRAATAIARRAERSARRMIQRAERKAARG